MPPTNFRLGARGAPPTRVQLNSHMQRVVWPDQNYTPPTPPDETFRIMAGPGNDFIQFGSGTDIILWKV